MRWNRPLRLAWLPRLPYLFAAAVAFMGQVELVAAPGGATALRRESGLVLCRLEGAVAPLDPVCELLWAEGVRHVVGAAR